MKIRLVRSLCDGKWVPFQQLSCDNDRTDHPQSPSNLQLAIPPPAVATAIGSYSRFKVPNDGSWIVKKVLRRDGSSIDKYYYEAGTGKKFRSLKEVERYINGEEYPVRRLCSYSQHQRPQTRYSKFIVRGGKVVRLDEEEYDQNHSSSVKSSALERTSITDLADRQLVPFQPLSCDNDHIDHHHSSSDCQLVISSPESGRYSGFKVPDDGDWIVQKVPRRDGSRIDKYYYEARTGMKFRSPKEVERYIKGREYPLCSDSRSEVVRLDEEEFNQNHPSIVKSSACERKSITDLPDGWVIEKVPRRLGGSDRYYYEPGTGRKFRSLVAVFRHLEEEIPVTAYIEEMKENAPLSKAFKLCHQGKEVFKLQMHWQQKGPRKRNRSNGHASSFVSRPKKVGWVLCSSEGDDWCPIICGQPVPDSVKQQRYQRYTKKMTDGI